MKYQKVKGSFDIVPSPDEPWKSSLVWKYIEAICHENAALYGFQEMRTPIFEYTDLFIRSVGENTDIIAKEMYTFPDKKGRSLSLRPEITAPIIRACIENQVFTGKERNFYYMGPCFRYDRAQKGRYRQFHQFGVESFYHEDAYHDTMILAFFVHTLHKMGIKNITLTINSLGTKEERALYTQALQNYLQGQQKLLSEDSKHRLLHNPLRILDSKEECDREILQQAPDLHDFFQSDSKKYFSKIQELLQDLSISFSIDPRLVRGLDYYEGLVFEAVKNQDGSRQNSLGGGGRYSGLVQTLGGSDEGAIGFALGLERCIQSFLEENTETNFTNEIEFYFIPLDAEAKDLLFPLAHQCRKEGHSAIFHTKNTGLKKALAEADLQKARFAIIVGPQEIQENKFIMKDLQNKTQQHFPIESFHSLMKEGRL